MFSPFIGMPHSAKNAPCWKEMWVGGPVLNADSIIQCTELEWNKGENKGWKGIPFLCFLDTMRWAAVPTMPLPEWQTATSETEVLQIDSHRYLTAAMRKWLMRRSMPQFPSYIYQLWINHGAEPWIGFLPISLVKPLHAFILSRGSRSANKTWLQPSLQLSKWSLTIMAEESGPRKRT